MQFKAHYHAQNNFLEVLTVYYLHEKSAGGAYMCPQSTPFDGAIEMNDDQFQAFLAFKGYGDIVNGVFTGNQSALDAWNAEHPDTPATPTPTETEKLRADVDYIAVMTNVDLGEV